MRYELADYEWAAIKPMLPNKPRGVPRVNDRRVLNGIFWVLRSGAPWRDLPEAFGPFTTCYNRFVRWRRAGVWCRIIDALAAAHDAAVQMIDTSIVRVRQHGACITKNQRQSMGRSRGGPTSKIHALVDGNGLPVRLALSPGEAHDNRLAGKLLSRLKSGSMLLADRGYDADWIRELAMKNGAWANIPPKSNRRDPICLDPHIATIEGWLAAQPQLTALAIVGRLGERYPEQFGTRQHSIVQRLLRALRRRAAEQLIAQEPPGDTTTAAPRPGAVHGSGYVGPDPPTALPVEQVGKATWRGRSADIASPAAMAPSG